MVFVLDKHKKPLMPCTEKRARLLLERSRAVIHKMAPFTIRLRDRMVEESELQPLRLKLDPGSKATGFAVLREDDPEKVEAVLLGEIRHRTDVKDKMDWTSVGQGSRKMCNTDKYGFPISHRNRRKMHFGFQTGDLVVTDVPKGKYAGRWVGRVAVRSSGYFDVRDGGRRVCQGVPHRHFRLLQRADGWQYEKERVAG